MRMRNAARAFLILPLLLAAACSPQPTAAPVEEQVVPVQVAEAQTGTVDAAAGVTAKLAPGQEVTVSPKINAKITSLRVEMGQVVRQGDVLYTLDATDLRNGVNQAEAAYQLAVANARQGEATTAQNLTQAENNRKQAEQALADARQNHQRMEQLFREGAVPAQQLEQAKLALTQAETAYANAAKGLETARKLAEAGVSSASVNQARVNLANAREQLANATVRAPISGVVAMVNGAIGELAGPQTPVVVIVDLDPVVAKVYLSEEEVGTIRKGTPATVKVGSLGKSWQATVSAVSPVMDPQLKSYPVEIAIPNPNGELKADMVADVIFAATGDDKPASMLTVPRQAVFDQDGKSYVYKLENDTARLVEVTTGAMTSERVEVKSGLAAGDQVVVRGHALLKDGTKVKVQNAGETP